MNIKQNKNPKKFNYKDYSDCYFITARYAENDNIAVRMQNDNEGCITMVTVNMSEKLNDDVICVKNWSENEGMDKWLKEMGFVEEEQKGSINNGFVTAPVLTLTDKGREYMGIAN